MQDVAGIGGLALSYKRKAARTIRVAALLLAPSLVHAAPCEFAWNGDQLADYFVGRNGPASVHLLGKDETQVAEVTLDQVRAFQEAKDRISRTVGLAPRFIICSDSAPNAFAAPTKEGPVVGVTVGMMKVVDGDRDEAAYILGHEIAHHTQHHAQNARSSDALIGLLGLLVGAVVESKTHAHYGPALGYSVGRLGAAMVSAKFTRDQEREADQIGLRYMVSAGYNPAGAIRITETFAKAGSGGIGLFFDNHPGWDEREARLKAMIADDFSIAEAYAKGQVEKGTQVASVSSRPSEAVNASASAEASPAQSLYTDAMHALRQDDLKHAADSLSKAAALNYAPAQAMLGFLYAHGQGVARDDAEAVRLYRLAADQGDALGRSNLGYMYAHGLGGLARDDAEAVRLYRMAANQDSTEGLTDLGFMYSHGRGGLLKDDAEAVRLYWLAASRGDATALADLGVMYTAGRGGLAQDDAKAAKLFRLAADRGSAAGQANLALMYEQGQGGLAKDQAEATRLYQLAAAQGNRLAQQRLAAQALSSPDTTQKAATENLVNCVSGGERRWVKQSACD
ncbi:MAG TPA: M48 family metalloprotease [Burkholderiales bacterium]|nr:M48 family metalloprotease [Burkholderiales bacterium]